MAGKHDLPDWVRLALEKLGGSATLVKVARQIWQDHEGELKASGVLHAAVLIGVRIAPGAMPLTRMR